jgi:hypothetical protein
MTRPITTHTLASLTALCTEEGECLIWPGIGPQRKKIKRPTVFHNGVRQSVRRLFAALRGDPQALAEQAGTAEPGHWAATCGDPHCMAKAHTVRRSRGEHMANARTRANVGATNQLRIAKIIRTKRAQAGKLSDEQIAAIQASSRGIKAEASVHGVSHSLISRIRRRNPARAAGTVWAGLGGRAQA